MKKPKSQDVPAVLDRITDIVLAHKPKANTAAKKKRKREAKRRAKTA